MAFMASLCDFTESKQRTMTSYIRCLAISSDLLYAASGSEINVYNLTNYTHINAFNSNSSSGSVKSRFFRKEVWQLTPTKRHQLVATLPTVKDHVRCFVLPKNYFCVKRHKKQLWIEHVDVFSGLAISNGLIYSVSWDKCLKVWRASDLRCLESVKPKADLRCNQLERRGCSFSLSLFSSFFSSSSPASLLLCKNKVTSIYVDVTKQDKCKWVQWPIRILHFHRTIMSQLHQCKIAFTYETNAA
uniref:Uncharacterized protein n=1 Tax=Nelumbo nucifera TaxID=4432 RepID=A0A822XLY5_NELNU|nr:TPA_asm: hypothetical protein HUJ06_021258 [Nelumbo nucifera]